MEEIEYLIKQEDYEKYKKLLQEFECKAIDIIEDLTYQFKETLAEEIDDKIKGWKKDNERILRENWEKDDEIKQLEQELAELKEKAIVPKFKIGQNIFFIDNECQIAQGVVDVILTGQDVFEKWCKYSIDLGVEYEDDIRFIDKNEEEIFATKEEAQEKLKEIQGNE